MTPSNPSPQPGRPPRLTDRLTTAQVSGVLAMTDAARAADGVAPLSEAFLMALNGRRAVHLLIEEPRGDGGLAAYGQVREQTAELFVAPVHRRSGLGTALLAAARDAGARTVWAHGDLPAARALARRSGWRATRTLLKMARPLTDADGDAPLDLPDGYTLRGFAPGDEEAWLRVNARAFASHPEQGRVTREDLDALLRQSWFEPAGLLLLLDRSGELAGSHWTKVDPHERSLGPDGTRVVAGEVYVLAVDPAHHGRGLAKPLTRAGLRHLARRGLRAVVLYVEADNGPALRTYAGLGFVEVESHTTYAPESGTLS